MDDNPRAARVFGKLVGRTSNMTDPVVLSHYILVLLKKNVGKDGIPETAQFTIKVTPFEETGTATITLLVYGLTDDYLTGGTDDPESTREAMYLGGMLRYFLSTFDWTNPTDPGDRRFRYDVRFLTEDQQQYSIFPPGEVWVVSLSSSLHLPEAW
jgi:hypothetical protein